MKPNPVPSRIRGQWGKKTLPMSLMRETRDGKPIKPLSKRAVDMIEAKSTKQGRGKVRVII